MANLAYLKASFKWRAENCGCKQRGIQAGKGHGNCHQHEYTTLYGLGVYLLRVFCTVVLYNQVKRIAMSADHLGITSRFSQIAMYICITKVV